MLVPMPQNLSKDHITLDIKDLEIVMRPNECVYTTVEMTLFIFLVTTFASSPVQEFVGTVADLCLFLECTEHSMDKAVKDLIDKDLILVKKLKDGFVFTLSTRATQILFKNKRGGEYVH